MKHLPVKPESSRTDVDPLLASHSGASGSDHKFEGSAAASSRPSDTNMSVAAAASNSSGEICDLVKNNSPFSSLKRKFLVSFVHN